MSMKKSTPIWETIAIFAAIFSLWPAVLRYWAEHSDSVTLEDLPLGHTINWAHPFWNVLMYAAFAVMVIVAIRRVRRVRRTHESNDSGPVDPYQSMPPQPKG